jgi:glycosyltransferase involved in cell wall biosynthesis
MRILQVAPYYSPRMGGSAGVVHKICEHLADQGHQVSIAAGDYGTCTNRFPTSEATEEILFPTRIAKWGFYWTPELRHWGRKHIRNYDLLHLHEVRTYQNLVAVWIAQQWEIPIVLSAHGTLPIICQKKAAKRVFDSLFLKYLLECARRLLAVSEKEVDQYRHLCIPNDRIRLVYNGLDLREFLYLPAKGSFRRRWGLDDPNTKVVLYLGRLHPRKGLRHLVKAYASLAAVDKRYRLVFVGPDEGELSYLMKMVVDLRLINRVLFISGLYGRERLAAMVDADVVVYVGKYEIFGLVPFEALLCGTPVIVADDSGCGALIQKARAGYVIPCGNVQALGEAIEEATSNVGEVCEMTQSGQAFIRKCLGWKVVIPQLEAVYQEALS